MVDRLSARCANGHEPVAGRAVPKYCTLCGAPMMTTCPNGHIAKIGRFCSVCGATLPPLSAPQETDPGAEPTAVLEPTHHLEQTHHLEPAHEPTHHRAHRSRLVIAVAVLLVLLVGAGAYFGVSKLTGNSPAHTAAAATSHAPAAATGQAAPAVSATAQAGTASTPASPSAPSTSPSAASSAPAATDPASVVNAYYAAINAGDYALAWALGGYNIESGSYYNFVQGFATTASDKITIVSVDNDVVTVHLDATQSDGTHRYFVGTYTVQNGVIVKAAIQQTNS